jgi:catechol 2,3-dioxygenase-like lactoylglutathione lyase family enzyme
LSGPVVDLDHAFLTMPEGGEPDARRFYGDVLGLEELERPEGLRGGGGVWFRVGDRELHLGTDEAHLAPKRPHPGFRVGSAEELDQLAALLATKGYDVAWDERIEGRKRFYTRDPFGNRVELLADL